MSANNAAIEAWFHFREANLLAATVSRYDRAAHCFLMFSA
jgi:hypothetical protein